MMTILKSTHISRHSLGDCYLFDTSKGIAIEASFSGDYVQKDDTLREGVYVKRGRIDISHKAVIRLSVMGGCPFKCLPCDAGRAGYFGRVSAADIVAQYDYIVNDQKLGACEKVKLHLSKLGEPSMNWEEGFLAIKTIISKYPHHNILPTVTTLLRSEQKAERLIADLFAFNHPQKALKINIGATNENVRNKLYGSVMSFTDIAKLIKKTSNTGDQRITLTLLAIPGETCNVEYFTNAIDLEDRHRYTVEIYKINQTAGAKENNYDVGLLSYKDASDKFGEAFKHLNDAGIKTYFSVPSDGETVANVATGTNMMLDV